MDQAQLTGGQFRYSSAHWQYIKRAFEPAPGYAYQACDPQKTVPGIGDLLCYSRGIFPLKNFGEWQKAVKEPGFSAAAHCDVVIGVDKDKKKMETIGGNVLQSVTRRKLKLNHQNLISSTHHLDHPVHRKNADCLQERLCNRANLNRQYWAVLLKLQ